MSAFITIVTEALPAGLLPQISAGLDVSESSAGQLVTVYATGSLLTAIPLTLFTQGMRRRPLLLGAITGFLAANSITAVSSSFLLTLAARFIAGISAGLLWALAAGYAARMSPAHLKGRAIAIAMSGTPLALSLGVPAGTYLGNQIGWRACFCVMSGLTLILIVWVLSKVPDYPGEREGSRQSISAVFALPGIRPVLFAVLAFVLAHNILYTYIAPFLAAVQQVERTGPVLLLFGIASLLSIWIVGSLVDRRLRSLTLGSILLFALACFALWQWSDALSVIYLATAAWGLAFGGCATLFQTACANAAGPATDIAQSMLVTTWNMAIAGGGLAGGLLLGRIGPASFAPCILLLLAATFLVVLTARHHGFPPHLHPSRSVPVSPD
ncbi:MFS transporter [Hyphomonas sp. ND6WE1B]|uniref:MFS transporter n=1 Tax=Hyphomonas sp. ND6WE1B TaxID=1848191 RepID=UPI0008075C6D|nr:MFS transporter [Hyphomonas sp. ND6WE1B]